MLNIEGFYFSVGKAVTLPAYTRTAMTADSAPCESL